ncbi:ApbE family protein [uncultured archaeon]|nr:ApbE family protein [uncultured archaeon]
MKETRIIMGMPVIVEIIDANATNKAFEEVFNYLHYVDEKFSTYKDSSEITKINNGEIREENYSEDMKEVFKLSEETKNETNGYFDIKTPSGKIDPSGLVKGLAIYNSAKLLEKRGFNNYYVEVAGDIQVHGKNSQGKNWRIGIRNPFNMKEIIKVLYIHDKGVATSGTYVRGQHVYNPHEGKEPVTEILSLTVIGPNIYEADRFATAVFAMGEKGITFMENLKGFEAYAVNN